MLCFILCKTTHMKMFRHSKLSKHFQQRKENQPLKTTIDWHNRLPAETCKAECCLSAERYADCCKFAHPAAITFCSCSLPLSTV